MNEYLEIYHRHFPAFESEHFDSRTVTWNQAHDLLESLDQFYQSYELPEKPSGEHWPHIGEIIYPIRPAAAWFDQGNWRRAQQVQQSFHQFFLPEIHRALLFSHGAVLWDPVYRELCLMRAGGLPGKRAFQDLTRDRLMTVQDLAGLIRQGLIRMTPHQDVSACVGDCLNGIGLEGTDPTSFIQLIMDIQETLSHEEAQKVALFAQYNAGWIGYRLRFDRNFDLFAQFRDDLDGLAHILSLTGAGLDRRKTNTLRLLASNCQFDPTSGVATQDLLKIRRDNEAFVEWRDLIQATLEPFECAEVIDSRELNEQFQDARARAGAHFKKAKQKSSIVRRLLRASGHVSFYGVAAASIESVLGGKAAIATAATAAATEVVNQARQYTIESRALERAKRAHVMIFEDGD